MSKTTRESVLTGIYIVAGIAGALVGWFLVSLVLRFRPAVPPLLAMGFFAGLALATARLHGSWWATMLLLLYMPASLVVQMFMISARTGRLPRVPPAQLLDWTISALPIALAIMVSVQLLKGVARPKVGKCLLTGLFLAAGHTVQMSMFLTRFHIPLQADFLVNQALIGAGVGLGIGLGMELVDLVWSGRGARMGFESPDAQR